MCVASCPSRVRPNSSIKASAKTNWPAMSSVCLRVLSCAESCRPDTPGSSAAQAWRRCPHKACVAALAWMDFRSSSIRSMVCPSDAPTPGRRWARASFPLSMPADNPRWIWLNWITRFTSPMACPPRAWRSASATSANARCRYGTVGKATITRASRPRIMNFWARPSRCIKEDMGWNCKEAYTLKQFPCPGNWTTGKPVVTSARIPLRGNPSARRARC